MDAAQVASGVLLGIAVLVGIWLVRRVLLYRRVFAPDRMLELHRALPGLREAARTFRGEGQPPHALLGEVMLLVYTMHEVAPGGDWEHHLSLSAQGGYTAHAVGRTFLLAASRLLQWPAEGVRFSRGQSSVFHAHARLSPAAHAAVVVAPIPPLRDKVEALRLQQDCLQASHALDVEDVPHPQ